MREIRNLDRRSKSLESFFEAFSFTGSNGLQLEAEVETCLDRCRPVSGYLMFYGRFNFLMIFAGPMPRGFRTVGGRWWLRIRYVFWTSSAVGRECQLWSEFEEPFGQQVGHYFGSEIQRDQWEARKKAHNYPEQITVEKRSSSQVREKLGKANLRLSSWPSDGLLLLRALSSDHVEWGDLADSSGFPNDHSYSGLQNRSKRHFQQQPLQYLLV